MFPCFLAWWDTPGSYCIFLALESTISSRSPVSFYWRIVLETTIWVLGMLVAVGMLLLPGFVSWKSKDIYGCLLTHISWHIYRYSHRQPFVSKPKHELIPVSLTPENQTEILHMIVVLFLLESCSFLLALTRDWRSGRQVAQGMEIIAEAPWPLEKQQREIEAAMVRRKWRSINSNVYHFLGAFWGSSNNLRGPV